MRSDLLRAVLAFGLAAATLPAEAGGGHDHHAAGPNGGRVEDAGPWHAELVTEGAEVAVHLGDASGRPMPATGFSGTAILVVQGKPARIPLAPDGRRLAGRADVDLGARPKGALRLTGPDGRTATARFE